MTVHVHGNKDIQAGELSCCVIIFTYLLLCDDDESDVGSLKESKNQYKQKKKNK